MASLEPCRHGSSIRNGEDSVLNQFEHFISLLRSHCAAFADRRVHDQGRLLSLALDSLEKARKS